MHIEPASNSNAIQVQGLELLARYAYPPITSTVYLKQDLGESVKHEPKASSQPAEAPKGNCLDLNTQNLIFRTIRNS